MICDVCFEEIQPEDDFKILDGEPPRQKFVICDRCFKGFRDVTK